MTTMISSLIALSLASANLPMSDGVAALVGDQPILVSEVREAIRFQEQSNPALQNLAPAQRCERMLSQLVDEKVILAKAKAETLEVSDAEVSQLVDRRVAEMTERAGGPEALQTGEGANGIVMFLEGHRDHLQALLMMFRVEFIEQACLVHAIGAPAPHHLYK